MLRTESSGPPWTSAAVNAVVTEPLSGDAGELAALRHRPDLLDVRADLVGDPATAGLRERFGCRWAYCLRSRDHGGEFDGSTEERHARLLAAAEHYDVVDLEADHDLVPAVLNRIPVPQRRISWHGITADHTALHARFDRMATVGAGLYLLTTDVSRAEQAMAPLRFLHDIGRPDVTAFATGSAGFWSRLLAPRLGAPVVFGSVCDGSADVPTVDRLVADYGFPHLPPLHAVYGIIGRSVLTSVSPRVHNTGYRALGIPALYVPFQVEDFASFWSDVADSGLSGIGLPLKAATVVSPHKEAALTTADTTSRAARRSGAANSLVRRGDSWCADTSNSPAVSKALADFAVPVSGRKAAVIGCGGAGRAAALALAACGAEPVLVNRDPDRGRAVAEALGFDFTPLDAFGADRYSLLVHATPVTDHVPFRFEPPEDAVVVDMVYTSAETAVVTAARERGLTVVDGWDVLLADAGCQFTFMTGQRLPTEQTRALLRAARRGRPDQTAPAPRT